MKIAICFHGLPRLIEKCYPDIYKYFIKNNIVDIYAHFWWDESHKGKINRLHVKERNNIKDNPIEIFKNLYKPKKIIYENNIKYDLSNYPIQGYTCDNIKHDTLYSKIMCSFLLYGLYSRFSSLNKCINLIENIEQYNIIIVLRTDLLLLKNICFKNETYNLNINKYIYFPSTMSGGNKYAGEHNNKLGDWMFFGKPSNVINFATSILKDIKTKNANNKNYKIYPKKIKFGKDNFFQLNNILYYINSNHITPLHNTERNIYWSKISNIPINIYNNSISVRRYIVEEYENINYIKNNTINPEIYSKLFNIEKNKMNYSELLPFYTDKITFIK